MAVRLQLKLGAVTEQDRLPDSPDTIVVVEPSVGSVGRTKGNLYLLVTRTVPGSRAREATRMVADTIRNEYYYDESAGIRQCLTKVLGVANKRLAHQRDRYGLGHRRGRRGPDRRRGGGRPRPRALRRDRRAGRGLPHPPGPPLDAAGPERRARPARRGLEPEVWRGELQVGDSLCLVSANVMGRIGTDALKDALVTLHPQSAIEHLHARFVAADGKGIGRRVRLRGQRGGGHLQGPDARPGPPGRAARRRARQGADPARGLRRRRRRRRGRRGRQGPDAAGNGFGRFVWRIQDLLPHRRPGSRKVTAATSRMETQRRAAVAAAGVHRRRRRRSCWACTPSQASSRPPSRSSPLRRPSGPSRRPRRLLRASPDPAWT